MKEILDSITENLKKRVTTPVYGTFAVAWLVFHWKFVFAIFFVSEDRIWYATGLLKNDYLSVEFFNFSDWYFYISWILPFIFTWLVIWYFPKWFLLPALEKEEQYRVAKKIIRIKEEKILQRELRDLEKEKIEKLEVVEEKLKKEKDIEKVNPEVLWQEEYIKFKTTKYYAIFNRLIESIYDRRGQISWYLSPGGTGTFKISTDLLSYAHSSDLLNLLEGGQTIEFTDKGKYFVKKFLLDSEN